MSPQILKQYNFLKIFGGFFLFFFLLFNIFQNFTRKVMPYFLKISIFITKNQVRYSFSKLTTIIKGQRHYLSSTFSSFYQIVINRINNLVITIRGIMSTKAMYLLRYLFKIKVTLWSQSLSGIHTVELKQESICSQVSFMLFQF